MFLQQVRIHSPGMGLTARGVRIHLHLHPRRRLDMEGGGTRKG
jgi:hypothetical protein